MNSQVPALAVVLTGTLLVPLGLRVVNGALPGAEVRDSYLPTVETPRPREPFDQDAANNVRAVQPHYVVIGDSMAGIRIDPLQLTRASRTRVVGLFHPGSPVAYWYLAFKNLVARNELKEIRGAIFFFRDDQLTTQVQVTPGVLDRVARDSEPELERVLAANRLGTFSDVHRAARSLYHYDRTRRWLEPLIVRAPAAAVADDGAALVQAVNTEVFALDRLRPFAASDLAQGSGSALDFAARVNDSLLPEILRLADESGIRLAFIRVQRRPTADGPPPQSDALKTYTRHLQAYLESRGAYFYDDWGDPDQPLSAYADGDHLNSAGKQRYTQRFAERHARFLQ
ncbi:MAG TPA: hypothetical protein VEA16_16065 [Vicinamibacterales bacterium]|nr:hypothetical protein [Vicinamibacterales bacterium]